MAVSMCPTPFPSARSRRPQRWTRLFLLSMVVPPLVISLAHVVPGAVNVIQTGTCPAFAPDLPPYPCSVWEYLFRTTTSVWAFLWHLITWMSWIVLNFILWGVGLFGVALYRNLRADK